LRISQEPLRRTCKAHFSLTNSINFHGGDARGQIYQQDRSGQRLPIADAL
jgi:hypothetical protein